MDDERGYDEALWGEMAKLGWLGLPFPEEQGGAGLGLVELGHLSPEGLVVASRVVHHGAHAGGGALLVQGRADRVAQQDLIFAEREVHRAPPTRSARASLGSPRMRSPMTFFWISEEPA